MSAGPGASGSAGRDALRLTPGDWERHLAAELQRPVRVRYGRARRTPVRAEQERGRLVVRLNGMFADAPREVQIALARWLRSGKRASRACRTLDDWIDRRLARLHEDEPRTLELRARGTWHDLQALADEVVAADFPTAFGRERRPRIGWGRAVKSRSRHTLRLGSYDHASRLVRVHAVLDQQAVPRWFVRYIVFHEHLHAALDAEPADDAAARRRRRHHGPEFRAREAQYPDLERVTAWEREHIAALIASARTLRPLRAPGRARRAARAGASWLQRTLFDGAR